MCFMEFRSMCSDEFPKSLLLANRRTDHEHLRFTTKISDALCFSSFAGRKRGTQELCGRGFTVLTHTLRGPETQSVFRFVSLSSHTTTHVQRISERTQ